MDDEMINRLTRHTSFTYSQIKAYAERVGTDSQVMFDNIIEADMFGIDIDLLGY